LDLFTAYPTTLSTLVHKTKLYNMKLLITTRHLVQHFGFLTLTIALGTNFVYATWSNPTQAPTGGNTPPPINTSNVAQSKTGDLQVANFRSTAETEVLDTLTVREQLILSDENNSDFIHQHAADDYTRFRTAVRGSGQMMLHVERAGESWKNVMRHDVLGPGPHWTRFYQQVRAPEYCDEDGNNCFGAATVSGGSAAIDERIRDVIAQAFNDGTHSGIVFNHYDNLDRFQLNTNIPDCSDGEMLEMQGGSWGCKPVTTTMRDCRSAGGQWYTLTDGTVICRFSGDVCPPSWSQYQDWSATEAVFCPLPSGGGSKCGPNPDSTCTTSARGWSNSDFISQCNSSARREGGGAASTCELKQRTCYSNVIEIGCVRP
jgi:hypothetical protein